jgi:hypothetical protein
MLDKDKVATRPEREEPSNREAMNVVEEIHIPDYAMLDFDFPNEGRYSLDTLYPPRGLLR